MRHGTCSRLYRELVDRARLRKMIGEAELVARGLATHARSNCVLSMRAAVALGVKLRPIDRWPFAT